MAPATRRTLSNVKSSAITARQPSVPNLMSAVGSWLLVVGGMVLVIQVVVVRETDRHMRLAKNQEPTAYNRFSHTSFFNFFSSKCFTTLPTSCEFSRVVTSNASSVSTTTMSFTPTTATNFP